jgi:seryl-tRNA synthetase
MLDIDFIRENRQDVQEAADKKGFDVDIDRLLELDQKRRKLIHETEQIRARRNEIADQIPEADDDDRPALIEEGKELKQKVRDLEDELRDVKEEYNSLLYMVPNVPLPDVPVGEDDEDNREVRKIGQPPSFNFEPMDHEQLGEKLGILDKERAIKFAGSRSYLLKGAGARLEFALRQLALDVLMEDGFEPVVGPLMVNEEAMRGTGFFPYGEGDTYHIEKDDKYLVGTSEVFLVSIHADEILEKDDLPKLYAGNSPCFRREAGSAGQDTRGVYRVHQFAKVEQAVICENDPELSEQMHKRLLGNAETVMEKLELPYRVATACTGESGLGQVIKHEIETWMPSRDDYCETHSCSSLYDYQARRSGIRYRTDEGDTEYCHTLNNTAVASPRMLIPLLENNQREDGSVVIPEALRDYMSGQEILEPVD